MALGLGVGIFVQQRQVNTPGKESSQGKKEGQDVFIANNTFVYGYWAQNASNIHAFDLSTGKNIAIAKLPSNVKHVKILSPSKIIYINNTDDRDYGTEITEMNALDGSKKTILKATPGFGIDDFVISENGMYLAAWEVSPPNPEAIELTGGKSRVTAVSLINPSDRRFLYDEVSGVKQPVRYPVAVTNTGGVFTDRFLPNTGSGWGYGISYSTFDGATQEDISSMANGTYSSQPVMSPDGTKLAFAGYDGNSGPGPEIQNGFRVAVVNPNTIEVLDLATRQRELLVPAKSGDIYPLVYWDLSSNDLIFNKISKQKQDSGAYIYNFAGKTTSKLMYNDTSQNTSLAVSSVITSISDNQILTGDETISDTAQGNLGNKYAPSLSAVYVQKPNSTERIMLDLDAEYSQVIGLFQGKYFSENNFQSPADVSETTRDQLQLLSFELKPSLAPKRIKQQSQPKQPTQPKPDSPQQEPPAACKDVAVEQCNQLLNTNYSARTSYIECGGIEYEKNVRLTSKEFADCLLNQCPLRSSGICSDSPLYIYGEADLQTNIFIGTPIFSPSVVYNPETGFDVTLLGNGEFLANGKKVSNIDYDYNPVIKIVRPKNGVIVPLYLVTQTLTDFGEKLGLTNNETSGVVQYALENIKSPFVFVSFFDHKTSHKILPLYFDPVPETYRNIVFYFEKLESAPQASFNPPEFDPITRHGFTAIEISFFVR